MDVDQKLAFAFIGVSCASAIGLLVHSTHRDNAIPPVTIDANEAFCAYDQDTRTLTFVETATGEIFDSRTMPRSIREKPAFLRQKNGPPHTIGKTYYVYFDEAYCVIDNIDEEFIYTLESAVPEP